MAACWELLNRKALPPAVAAGAIGDDLAWFRLQQLQHPL